MATQQWPDVINWGALAWVSFPALYVFARALFADGVKRRSLWR